MIRRTGWDRLSAPVRAAVEDRTGAVRSARTAPAGKNSAVAALLATDDGPVFVKGLRVDDPRATGQDREAAVSRYVTPLSPALLWRTEVDGWDLLGFRAAPGRHADYTPGSTDLPKVIDAIRRLAQLGCPDLPNSSGPKPGGPPTSTRPTCPCYAATCCCTPTTARTTYSSTAQRRA